MPQNVLEHDYNQEPCIESGLLSTINNHWVNVPLLANDLVMVGNECALMYEKECTYSWSSDSIV
jgi:hypothetical protein